jgi:hypothetical protein
MFGKVASICVVMAIATLASVSRGAALGGSSADDLSPLSPAYHRDLDIPQVPAHPQNAKALPRTNTETPTAPLPPALWPGLLLLVSLGGAKVVLIVRRQIARG